jgi:hypothetical protein
MTEYERFGLVFTKTWVYKFGHLLFLLSLLMLKSCGYEIPAVAGFSAIAGFPAICSVSNDPSVPTLVYVLAHVL